MARILPSLALLAVVGCTYDYDTFLEGESGGAGGAAAASTSASTSTGGPSSSSGAGAGSSSTGGGGPGSSTSATGTGGDGAGGGGGGEGGSGGAGGGFPGDDPCPGLSLPPAPENDADFGLWSEVRSGDPGNTRAFNVLGQLAVVVDSSGTERYAEIRSPQGSLMGCSVAIPLKEVDVDDLDDEADYAVAFVSALVGETYRGFEVRFDNEQTCSLHVTENFSGDDAIPPSGCSLGSMMRVRHTGNGKVCFDQRPEAGDWEQLHCVNSAGPERAVIGFEANDDTDVSFGSIEGG